MRCVAVSLGLLLVGSSCGPSTAPSRSPDAAEPPGEATADTEAGPALPEDLAKRLERDEQRAAEIRARWTPQLRQTITELTAQPWPSTEVALEAILASPHRTPGNADRDPWRHPRETLTFFGLEPDMRVFEYAQGAGWYTEILAPLLAHDGVLHLTGYDPTAGDPKLRYAAAATELFLRSPGNLYDRVVPVVQPNLSGPPNLGEPGSLDMVLVLRMLHNVHRSGMWDALMPAAHAALRPGGVLAVVQHRAPDDADPDQSAPKGYLPEPWLIEKVEGYGFRLEASSEINANPRDTKDYAQGVWTLPPTLARGDEERERYLAIGESDRSTLKFVKVGD